MSGDIGLGKLVADPAQQRDAVHIACIPVVAGETLAPGARVTMLDGLAFATGATDGIGVIDPFLAEVVPKGARCWLMLLPGSIRSLRHEWRHPAFPSAAPDDVIGDPRVYAEHVLRAFVAQHENVDYDELIGALTSGEGYTQHESESLRNATNVPETKAEFWRLLEILAGRKFSEEHRADAYFDCSC
jgi:hypothetical protein